jgi:hypothetical protein
VPSRWFWLLPLSAIFLAASVQADVVTASNAGALPGTAEDLSTVFVTEILGAVSDPADPLLGVNMFAITIADPLDFSAIAQPLAFGIPDTVLFLFDASGNGVLANDDISGANTLSCLPSGDVNNPCLSPLPAGLGPTMPGLYYLAISLSANYPTSVGNEIFAPVLSTDVVGPALTGNNPVDGFDGNAFTSPDFDDVNYDILLTGTAAPEPATLGLTGGALLALCMVFRKRNARTSMPAAR